MANLFHSPTFALPDSNGDPIPGAKLNFYEAGTTNRADTYTDNALSVAHANPVIADGAGRFDAIYLQAIEYKVVWTDASNVVLKTWDPVHGTLDTTGDDFAPSQQSPADMTVLVAAGSLYNQVTKALTVKTAQTSSVITAPSGNPRIDIIHIDRLSGVIGIDTGSEAGSPVDPAITSNKLPVCRVTLATTTTEITDSLITDIRELNTLGASHAVRYNTGVDNGEIPLMDATGYPAADGSQITDVVAASVAYANVTGAPAPGSKVWLYTETIGSSVATVDIEEGDLDWTAYDIYEIEVIDLQAVNNDVEIYLRVYDTTLAAWQSDADDYMVAAIVNSSNFSSLFLGNSNGAPEISFMEAITSGKALGNAADESFSAAIKLYDPADTTYPKQFSFQTTYRDADTIPQSNAAQGTGAYKGTTNAISGIRFLAQSGNIDGGKIVVYGIKTS